jgi:putative ABC transport system permease protein
MVVALAVGIPVGLVCGRLAWLVFTRQVGVLPVLQVPMAVGVIAPAALAIALIVSALPAGSAARTRPAAILRTE